MNVMDDSGEETIQDFEERVVLSRRRAVIFILFIGLIVVEIMFFIRIDIYKRLGTTMRLVEKTSPIFLDTVKTVLEDITENPIRDEEASYFQRHPRELLNRLFGIK